MSLRDQWENLSPNAKRATVAGAAIAGILALAAGAGMMESPRGSGGPQSERDTLVRSILTDADPRELGVEAMAARIQRMEREMGELRDAASKAQQRAAEAEASAQQSPDSGAAEDPEAALERQVQLEEMRKQIEELRAAVAESQQAQPPAAPIVLPEPVPPPVRTREPRPLDTLFSAPQEATAPTQPLETDAGRRASAARALTIRTVAAAPPDPSTQSPAGAPATQARDAIFIPAGGILSGVLLNGVDMPTGQSARQNPTPALVRIKDLALLPNRVRADVRECFVITSGFGEMSSERAFLRGETFSCIRADGGVIEVPINAYAVGEDGKVGLRGRVVSKQGALLSKSLMAGFLQGFSQLFSTQPVIPVSDGTSSSAQFQTMFSPEAMQGAAARGAGDAMERLADYYLDLADQLHPVLEVDAGRGVELILSAGFSVRLAK